jgi:hypothetical protein
MISHSLGSLIRDVIDARLATKSLHDELQSRRAAWDNANHELLMQHSATLDQCREAEEALRRGILENFQQTGDKAPAPGLGVRETTAIVYDEGAALNWALEHHLALQLDTAAFKRLAKAVTPSLIPIVEISTVPQATISPNLSNPSMKSKVK